MPLHFELRDVRKCNGTVELFGVPSSKKYKGQTWIGEKWTGYLGRAAEAPVCGRWFPEGGEWRLVTEDKAALRLEKGEDLLLYDRYWGERVSMVLSNLVWRKEAYVPKMTGDHEHCGICWATITLPHAAICYRSEGGSTVCPECYQRFVLPQSIEFIP